MKTLIAITSALFITVACQKKVETPVVTPVSTQTIKVVDEQKPCEDTTTVSDIEKPNEVECQD